MASLLCAGSANHSATALHDGLGCCVALVWLHCYCGLAEGGQDELQQEYEADELFMFLTFPTLDREERHSLGDSAACSCSE